jgi:hypothetical protein
MKILRPRSKLPAGEEGGGSPASGHTERAARAANLMGQPLPLPVGTGPSGP